MCFCGASSALGGGRWSGVAADARVTLPPPAVLASLLCAHAHSRQPRCRDLAPAPHSSSANHRARRRSAPLARPSLSSTDPVEASAPILTLPLLLGGARRVSYPGWWVLRGLRSTQALARRRVSRQREIPGPSAAQLSAQDGSFWPAGLDLRQSRERAGRSRAAGWPTAPHPYRIQLNPIKSNHIQSQDFDAFHELILIDGARYLSHLPYVALPLPVRPAPPPCCCAAARSGARSQPYPFSFPQRSAAAAPGASCGASSKASRLASRRNCPADLHHRPGGDLRPAFGPHATHSICGYAPCFPQIGLPPILQFGSEALRARVAPECLQARKIRFSPSFPLALSRRDDLSLCCSGAGELPVCKLCLR